MALRSGTRLGPYEILAPLGAGGMGEVYRARDTRLNRDVAVKVLPSELASDASRLKRFEKEARSVSALNHPNIVTVYDIGAQNGVSYIAMERVEGETLRKALVNGPLPVKKLLPIATQIAEGLAKAHEAGIVHRDLKPENLMVTKDGLVKILDFGLAKPTHVGSGSDEESHLPTETGTSPGMIVGTVGYMSPEQASGESVDFRSDQFSFGSIVYEMATGKRAFLKKTGVDTLGAILNEEPQPIAALNPQLPAPLRWIIDRCLAKDPEGRYASTKDLARDLAGLRGNLSEAPSGTLVRSRQRTRFAFAAGAALVVVAVLAFLVLRRNPSGAGGAARPRFEQVTFGLQTIIHARFVPGSDSVVYSAMLGKAPQRLYEARLGNPESRPLDLPPATIASISSSGEMAILLGSDFSRGTLAIARLAGGAPREILEDVRSACWSKDGKTLAVVHVVNGRDRLEFPIGKVLFEAPGSQAPGESAIEGCRVSPGGARIAFSDMDSILVVDEGGKVTRVGPREMGSAFAWSPRGDEILYAEYAKAGVTELHAVTLMGEGRLLASLPGDLVLMDVSERGRILLELASEDMRVFGRLAGDKNERPLGWLQGTSPADLSRDGGLFLFDEARGGYSASQAVYLRRAGDSPPVRLGRGWGQALSPDGRWAAVTPNVGKPPLVLVPTGPGQEKSLPAAGLIDIGWSNWLPGGGRILFSATGRNEKSRLFVQDVSGGDPRPISPEGYRLDRHGTFVSPDGSMVVARDAGGRAVLFPIDKEATVNPTVVAGLRDGETPVQWSADGKWLFVQRSQGSSTVDLLDPVSGQRKPWRALALPDPSFQFSRTLVTPDGASWVSLFYRYTSNLYFLEGLI